MRAAFVPRPGPAETIRVGELPDPVRGEGEVLVDVSVSAVDPVDTFVRSGLFEVPGPWPLVLGRDFAGRVAEDGGGFSAGEPVWGNSLGHGGRQGAAATRVAVAVERLYRLPDGADPAEFVAVVHPAATAYLALFTHGRLCAGETVVVAGGGGNVGSALIELATNAGARVVATASARDLAHCRALGAVEALDYRDGELPGDIDLYVDTSGTNDLAAVVPQLAWRGRIVLLAGPRSRPVLPAGELYMHDRSVLGFAISHATAAELADAAKTVNERFAAGGLRPRAVKRLALSDAAEAHRRIEGGEARGTRLVLDVDSAGRRSTQG
ncbi:zinc-binding dehydrogenase [Amycolatopsis jiangsuensis]|uniref:NADPH:quinone reductase-like Zn-dependent oxidoreductase n=1 Tax=Amycolatopsis jiangsuensis TaxID=1181879 RepID=A0A840IT79_9PSEU|nr:zinc-binding dehydrogenase [Amycolatopsis jiangsuensis]MBB4685841.1 NADPH:quinone reductase-like Zn-dependent oxidoreductase [Amycolatopsis jiangsuensis]